MTGKCEECGGNLGCFSSATACHECEKIMCSKCASNHPLIPFDRTAPNDEANDLSKHGTAYPFCKKCFQETSMLDFSRTYDVVEPAESTKMDGRPVMTLLFAHGGGACRALMKPYADKMAQVGHRSILLDLPGHGTLVDTPLTLDACVSTVQAILDGDASLNKQNTIYVGASLGAYIGFYVLDKLKDRFGGAILIDCGQNVGPDCSYKAAFGMVFLRLVSKNMSNMGLLNAMKGVSIKSPANWKLIESTFGAGMFFDSGVQQADCLHSVVPANHIPKFGFPCIFFNGSEDHRDSEDKWLSLCQDQKRSYLKVYEGGDHFFTHDSRFVEDLVGRMDKFAKEVAQA